MDNKDTLFKCDTCGAEKFSEGDSLHCWDITYKCGSSIIGAIGRDAHQTDKPCPYEDEADRLKAEKDKPELVLSELTHADYNQQLREKQIKAFREKYREDHACCPKCGSLSHSTTLVGYVLNWDDRQNYKDLNRCKCGNCGDVHITHDRVPYLHNEELLVGKEALIIDMIRMDKKKVKIEESPQLNKIWFEGDYDWTSFANDRDFILFSQGKAAWIHPDEVLIALI
jgi:transcription elongation factor Elf1